jgi:xylulokinase
VLGAESQVAAAYGVPMPSLLCLDLGTSAAKAALIDPDGSVHGQAVSGYPTTTTPDGGAEQDPADWVRSARSVITEILGTGPGRPEIAALCLTGQMQDLVLEGDRADGTDGGIIPAVLYSDTRAAREADELHHLIREQLTRKAPGVGDPATWEDLTGSLQDATSCAAMFRRLARSAPERVRRARGMVFGPAGHLAHLLGCGLWCDPTTAAATGLLEARTRSWSSPVARAAGIDERLLPALTREAGQIIGSTGADAEALLGLPAGVPVVLAPGDAGATTLGIVGLEPGDDYVYLGTSGWRATVLASRPAALPPSTSCDDPVRADASHHLALAAGEGSDGDDRTLRISALLAAGAAAAWARDALLGGAGPAEADALLELREREQGRGPTGLLALPSILGERYPVRDPDLRAAILGMGPQTRGIDMYAAVLEGVAHALAPASDQGGIGGASPSTRALAVTGGGAASGPWLRILADVLGRPVRVVDGSDAALVGCAIAGADALGLEHGIRPLAARDGGRVVHPDPSAARAHAALRPAHRALYTATAEVNALR